MIRSPLHFHQPSDQLIEFLLEKHSKVSTTSLPYLFHPGILADIFWHELKHHHKNVDLDAFQVMPNHIHGILTLIGNVETRHALFLPPRRFQNSGKNTISSIIGSYKSAVTKHANRLGLEFGWQPNYHDHIIRNEMEYALISDYICKNVANWKEDKFYKCE